MNFDPDGLVAVAVRVVGFVRELGSTGTLALASVAQHLLTAVGSGAAQDFSRYKEARLNKAEAEGLDLRAAAAERGANTMKTLQEAITIHGDRVAEAASVSGSTTSPAAASALAAADEEVARAMAVLAQYGGGLFVDPASLARLATIPTSSAKISGGGAVEAAGTSSMAAVGSVSAAAKVLTAADVLVTADSAILASAEGSFLVVGEAKATTRTTVEEEETQDHEANEVREPRTDDPSS